MHGEAAGILGFVFGVECTVIWYESNELYEVVYCSGRASKDLASWSRDPCTTQFRITGDCQAFKEVVVGDQLVSCEPVVTALISSSL